MQRKHAKWSASETHRNWLCPGNIALKEDVVTPPESKAAAWGTACHEVAEKILTNQSIELGDQLTTERHVFYVDLEMIECAGAYVDYIRDRMKNGYDLVGVEKNYSMDRLNMPMEAGGTADCVLYNSQLKELEVVDLKTGKGLFVDADGNPQERFYAVLALINNNDAYQVETIRCTIVQPRLPHKDGLIRSEVVDIMDLMEWLLDLGVKVNIAAEAVKEYQISKENQILLDIWTDAFLTPGEVQCTFCKAAGACPALRRDALNIAGVYEDDTGIHMKSNAFVENTPAQVEADLDLLENLENWVRERRALAHEMAQRGHQFDHWVLVDKIGHRKFTLSELDVVHEIRKRLGAASDEQLYDRKLKSPAGMEKSFGKKTVEVKLGDLIERPVTGTDLIRSTSTNRKPADTRDRFWVEIED